MGVRNIVSAAVLAAAFITAPALAQTADEGLKIHFATGSSAIGSDGVGVLDTAARLFRDGNPIVMIVAGVADTVGRPESNLRLSIRRAQAVADGLVARGIPADRLQVLGRGNSDLVVQTADEVDSPENRIVSITWR